MLKIVHMIVNDKEVEGAEIKEITEQGIVLVPKSTQIQIVGD